MIDLTAATPLGAGDVRPAACPPVLRGVSSACAARLCEAVPVATARETWDSGPDSCSHKLLCRRYM